MNNAAPFYLTNVFHCYQPTTTMSLRHTTENERESHRITYMNNTELSNKCIFKRLVDAWNSLPLSLRMSDSLNSFKRDMKTYFFEQAFEA